MPLRYFHPSDEDQLPTPPPPLLIDDESTDWWAGAQKCFAGIALAAVLSVTAQATAVASTLQWQDEIPAGSLYGQPDEDYWQNPVAPVPAANLWPQPFIFDVQEPAGSLFGQPDEDYWQNPVPPITSYPPPIVFRDDDIIVPEPAVFNLDEDYWQNAVPPAQRVLRPLYLLDPEEIPANSLFGQADEDFWIPSPQQQLSQVPKAFADDDVLPVAAVAFSPDEDYWLVFRPEQISFWPKAFTDEEVPAATLFGQPDEDYWNLGPVPVAASNYQRLPYLPDPEELPAGSLFGQADEAFWLPPRPWAISSQPIILTDDEILPITPAGFTPDEDYWQPFIWQAIQGQAKNFLMFPYPSEAGEFVIPAVIPPGSILDQRRKLTIGTAMGI